MRLTTAINRRAATALIVAALSCEMAYAAEPLLGTLPAGSLSKSEMSGVRAEICRDHLFDPASTALRLPTGYRFLTDSSPARAGVSGSPTTT